ncbi:MAG: response regulator transcription factor [Pseudomonadota bacterium]
MSHVTVVEDNTDLREEVVFHLRHAGHEAVGVPDSTGLDHTFSLRSPEVVLLDIGLPGEDGFSIAARLRRSHPDIGIVILTARGLIEDKLHGLHAGADAYLVKPVDMRELVAVVASVSRRLPSRDGSAGDIWKLDTTRREVISPAGSVTTLTHTEYRLLLQLAEASPEIASRRALVEALGHDFLQFDERRLEAALSRLRKKLKGDSEESVLRSARTHGYVFAAQIRIVSTQ